MSPRASSTVFMPMTPALRRRLEATIEQLVALLDEIDGERCCSPPDAAGRKTALGRTITMSNGCGDQ